MSYRPQWMKEAAWELGGLLGHKEAEVVIARHYAAEDARVMELREAAEELCSGTSVTHATWERMRKALKAFEPVSASSAGGEHG